MNIAGMLLEDLFAGAARSEYLPQISCIIFASSTVRKYRQILIGGSRRMLTEHSSLWDEAIAALLEEEQAQLDAPMNLEKLQSLAVDHAIRLGDILETLYLMAIYGDWQYIDEDGGQKELDEEALQTMYAQGRIDKSNAEAFNGAWIPSGFYPRAT